MDDSSRRAAADRVELETKIGFLEHTVDALNEAILEQGRAIEVLELRLGSEHRWLVGPLVVRARIDAALWHYAEADAHLARTTGGKDIFVDAAGNLYVASVAAVFRISPTGEIARVVDVSGDGAHPSIEIVGLDASVLTDDFALASCSSGSRPT